MYTEVKEKSFHGQRCCVTFSPVLQLNAQRGLPAGISLLDAADAAR